MKNSPNQKPFSVKFLVFLQIFLGIGAVFGGLVLVIDPSGSLIKMPISLLEQSPFHNFLIPGIILFSVLGMIPLIVTLGLITKRDWKKANALNIFKEMYWSWTYSLYLGFALIIWITAEVYFIKHVAIIHVVYIGIGLAIQAVTLLPSVQKYYFKENTSNR